MEKTGIKPTVTHLVRSFLFRCDARIKPWSTLDETYTALYTLLKERRRDPAFWEPLADLLRAIIDNSVNPNGGSRHAIPHAELLTRWDIDELVGTLRVSLPIADNESPHTEVKRFCRSLSTPVLAGFSLLGLALSGCENGNTEPLEQPVEEMQFPTNSGNENASETASDSNVAPESSTPAVIPDWYTGCSLPQSSIFFETIDKSTMKDGEKSELCECLSTLHASWQTDLTYVFTSKSPEYIARVLESILNCCEQHPDQLKSKYGGSPSNLDGIDSRGCNVIPDDYAVPLYKGVSFPR